MSYLALNRLSGVIAVRDVSGHKIVDMVILDSSVM